jgi:hypothetical protein
MNDKVFVLLLAILGIVGIDRVLDAQNIPAPTQGVGLWCSGMNGLLVPCPGGDTTGASAPFPPQTGLAVWCSGGNGLWSPCQGLIDPNAVSCAGGTVNAGTLTVSNGTVTHC